MTAGCERDGCVAFMRSYEYGDPAKVLERRGEDCTHCRSLERWNVAGSLVWRCDNRLAPERNRKGAPAKRCNEWKPHKEDSGV